MTFRRLTNISVIIVFCLSVLTLSCMQKEDGWIQLFNGKNLKGWKIKIAGHPVGENYNNTIRVEDGLLKVSYDGYETFDAKFGHIFYEKPFSHYIIRAEYRFVGVQCPEAPGWALRNNGIMFHAQAPESMKLDQNFPVSIEAQMLGGDGFTERTTGNVCTPGTNIVMNGELETRHCINSISKTFHGDQWVVMEVEVHGSGRIIHRVNGEAVFEYEQPQLDPEDASARELLDGQDLLLSSGYIAFQAESHPIEFRKIEVKELDE